MPSNSPVFRFLAITIGTALIGSLPVATGGGHGKSCLGQAGCHQCGGKCNHHNCETCHGVDRDPGHPAKPKWDKPGDIDRGDCPPYRYTISDCQRAWCPRAVHRFAKCSVTDKYSAWYVGGGAAFAHVPQLPIPLLGRGGERESNAYHDFGEGTWGLDYGGLFGKANIWLDYTCGRKQGGEGAYETDGEPKFVKRIKACKEHVKEALCSKGSNGSH